MPRTFYHWASLLPIDDGDQSDNSRFRLSEDGRGVHYLNGGGVGGWVGFQLAVELEYVGGDGDDKIAELTAGLEFRLINSKLRRGWLRSARQVISTFWGLARGCIASKSRHFGLRIDHKIADNQLGWPETLANPKIRRIRALPLVVAPHGGPSSAGRIKPLAYDTNVEGDANRRTVNLDQLSYSGRLVCAMTHQLQEHSEWLVLFGAGCVCYGDVLDDGFFDAVLYDDGFFDAVSYRNSSAVFPGPWVTSALVDGDSDYTRGMVILKKEGGISGSRSWDPCRWWLSTMEVFPPTLASLPPKLRRRVKSNVNSNAPSQHQHDLHPTAHTDVSLDSAISTPA
ncbi:hypothetical protein FIBSPDRAFT_927915 [Athelia psychrophila]|uniref:Uncharacterized protein n=1 Tax=Athelia psychrophila TaxID=1759441 RepID=A0A166R6K7_9AGAM|nr:hypothetical protein FIBSPDRAFT_927915 [Fibularhizoctonia sp. CBS 109695]